jgi:hypothetical protein
MYAEESPDGFILVNRRYAEVLSIKKGGGYPKVRLS